MCTTIRTKLIPTDSGLVNTDFLEDLMFMLNLWHLGAE